MTPISPHVLLARMEAARRETRHHLDLVLRQIAARAERVTVTQKAKSTGRTHKRAGSRWAPSDERLFQSHLQGLEFQRRGEIEALSRKLVRHEAAIAAFLARLELHGDINERDAA
ncbi:conserved hypothetical protein [Agrobacterium deltaense Zutra 3/1]|uniref:Uncharacterized protein n=1 Tax=Agrobacterium deltaense Zutra 3/1 TaxID=1183427 RepID=A0A1S7S1V0_9HYPH|nr:hypothetical protein [Agrobacterium deltaense]CUX61325.1 conserved hypothetical protein [Agrobacterium deltaense Zutra 3/1]